MDAMSNIDRDLFREKYEDLKYMETKYVRKIVGITSKMASKMLKCLNFLYQTFFLE